MADDLLPPTPDFLFYHNILLWCLYHRQSEHAPDFFFPNAVPVPTKTVKQDKPPSLSAVSTLQVQQYVTHIDSNRNQFLSLITKVMSWSFSGDPMYLVEVSLKQTQQANIYSFRKPSNTEIFSSTAPFGLYIPTHPKKTATNNDFGTNWHTPGNTTVYPASHVYQRLQQQFQQAVTGHQILANNTIADTPLLLENLCDLSKLIPVLRNFILKDDTLIDINQFND